MPITTITVEAVGDMVSDGTAIIPGMIHGITDGVIPIIITAGTALGITADGILHGITAAGTGTAHGIITGTMVAIMIHGIMVTAMAMEAGMVADINGVSMMALTQHWQTTVREEVPDLTEQVQQIHQDVRPLRVLADPAVVPQPEHHFPEHQVVLLQAGHRRLRQTEEHHQEPELWTTVAEHMIQDQDR